MSKDLAVLTSLTENSTVSSNHHFALETLCAFTPRVLLPPIAWMEEYLKQGGWRWVIPGQLKVSACLSVYLSMGRTASHLSDNVG